MAGLVGRAVSARLLCGPCCERRRALSGAESGGSTACSWLWASVAAQAWYCHPCGQSPDSVGQPSSPYVGVSWAKKERRWKAAIMHKGRNQNLGDTRSPSAGGLATAWTTIREL